MSGLMSLISYGAQDTYLLAGNPQPIFSMLFTKE